MNKKENNFIPMTFGADVSIPEPVESVKKNQSYVGWGTDNLYPQFLSRLYYDNPYQTGIINGKVLFITGSGIDIEAPNPENLLAVKEFLRNQGCDFSVNEIIESAAFDLELYNGFCFKGAWNKDKSLAFIEHIDFDKIRSNKEMSTYYYSEDWSTTKQSEEATGYKEYINFNPSIRLGEFLFYYKAPNKTYPIKNGARNQMDFGIYPKPTYSGAIKDIMSDVEISNFHFYELKNGMKAGTLITLTSGVPAPEEKDAIESAYKNGLTNTDSAGGVMINFVEGAEEIPDIQNLNGNDLDKRYLMTEEAIRKKIFVAHSVISPSLFGLPTQGSLGSTQEMEQAYYIFVKTYVRGRQKQIEQCLNFLMNESGITGTIKLKEPESFFEKEVEEKEEVDFNEDEFAFNPSQQRGSDGRWIPEGKTSVEDKPCFKSWFDGSMVVSEDGSPLEVYHGSPDKITAFDPDRTGQGVDQLGSGFYFTNNKDEAFGYSQGSGNIVKAYLSIKNPIIAKGSNLNNTIDMTPDEAYRILKQSPKIYGEDSPLQNWYSEWWDGGTQDWMIRKLADSYNGANIFAMNNDFFNEEDTAFRTAINDVLGYDGIIQDFQGESGNRKHFISWFPNQIKSVDAKSFCDEKNIGLRKEDEFAFNPLQRRAADGKWINERTCLDLNKIDKGREKTTKKDAKEYSKNINAAKTERPEIYWSVDEMKEEEAAGGIIITKSYGSILLGKNGDLKGLYKNPETKVKGVGVKLMTAGIRAGGRTGDNFDGHLTRIYEEVGFRVVGRTPFNEQYAPDGWVKELHDTPDVVAMIYDPRNELNIEEKTFTGDDGYDEMIAYRNTKLNLCNEKKKLKLSDIDSKKKEGEDLEDLLIEKFSQIGKPKSKGNIVFERECKDGFATEDAERLILSKVSKQTYYFVDALDETHLKVLKMIIGEEDVESISTALGLKSTKVLVIQETLQESGYLNEDYSVSEKGMSVVLTEGRRLDDFEVVYTYEKRRELKKEEEIIPGSRGFCRAIIKLDRQYLRNEIDSLNKFSPFAKQGLDVWNYRGGWWNRDGVNVPSCRHIWKQKVIFK